jgi:hypothetical protein
MKRISYLFFLIFLASLFASSCSSTPTYAQLLDDEQALIHGFVVRNNIQLVSTFPADSIWMKNGKEIYAETASGLYFHMVNYGDSIKSKDTLLLNNTVVPRFLEYTLGVPADTISNWTTVDYPYPSDFVYGDLTQSCKAFQEAASYLKRNGAQCKLIVPSKIGFNADMMAVIPRGYDLKIKFQR